MFVKELTLKSGRKIEMMGLKADSNLDIYTTAGNYIPTSEYGAILFLGIIKVAYSISRYQQEDKTIKSDKPVFNEIMHIRPPFKNYKEIKNFLHCFSDAEQEEMAVYFRDLFMDKPLETEEDVENNIKDSIEGKF